MELNELKFTPQSRVIVSIFPIKCDLERDFGPTMKGGRTRYVLEAAPKDGYTSLVLNDCFQRVQDVMKSEIGKPRFIGSPVSADEIANDCMTHWVEQRIGTASGFRPGIMKLPEGQATPTEADLFTLNERQKAYSDALILEANGMAAKHDWKNITDLHRAMAIWRGYQVPLGQSDWVAQLGKGGEFKECVECFSKIDARATKCKICMAPQVSAATAPPVEPAKATGKSPLPPPVKSPAQQVAA